MTGADILSSFSTQYDEVQSGYFATSQLQEFCDLSLQNVWQKLCDDFQNRQQTTDELSAHLKKVTVTPGANNLIDISPTSVSVPDYKALINIQVAFTVNNQIKRARATQMKTAAIGAQYGQGSLLFPKYLKRDSDLQIFPLDYTCTEAIIDYITEPTAIDLTNSVVEVPYTPKMIQRLIAEMMVQVSKANREINFSQANIQQEVMNP